MRHVFSLQSLPVSRWRNGGGETREIIRFPPDAADFAWRASIATIACDGPFSTFNGVDRTITLLNGSPVLLHGATCEHRLLPEVPWAFAGEWALEASLQVNEPSQDFNVMTRRGEWRAQAHVVTEAVVSEHGVAWVLAGKWHIAGETRLDAQQGAWWVDHTTLLQPDSSDARLLFVRLTRVL
ncbi:HutD/Ves family protein [Pantoea allii]|uniref:HutD/Ves family protein n=1 Tax=Pantoea allii TaxID=574096 RepID=UPI003D30F2E0